MPLHTFRLSATITGAEADDLREALQGVLGPKLRIDATTEGLRVEVEAVVGVEARELNRRLLSEARRVRSGIRLRSEWTADGVTVRFRDYVLVKERPRSRR